VQHRYQVNQERARCLKKGERGKGPVLYWISREQRAHDNWALLFAQERAMVLQRPLLVVFCLDPNFPGATLRQSAFFLRGLKEVQEELERHSIPLLLLEGDPIERLPAFLALTDPTLLVMDFDPLRIKLHWQQQILSHCRMPVYQVDAHNIVPCWLASDKREYGAYTIRPKIDLLLPSYLTDFPVLRRHPYTMDTNISSPIQVKPLLDRVRDRSVAEIHWLKAGQQAGTKVFYDFLHHRLPSYHQDRNNPCRNGQSNLSPYFHFGQVAPQRIAWAIQQSQVATEAKKAYLEELIIRRELADNFCHYTPDYDRISAFPDWSKKSHAIHRHDPRPALADLKTLENAATADELWNGCQRELVKSGKLHGYLRMYWAKKILEWTPSPEEAMASAIFLNDRYSLDGCDPNGYAGIAWSIGGVHDRAWSERPIFGKIRYMNQNGCRRKFKISDYLQKVGREA